MAQRQRQRYKQIQKQKPVMTKVMVLINEDHTLLPEQQQILNDTFDNRWETYSVPAEGWTLDEVRQQAKLLAKEEIVVFVSPVPYLVKALSFERGWNRAEKSAKVYLFHNDNRNKKELPNGKVISVVSKIGWKLV